MKMTECVCDSVHSDGACTGPTITQSAFRNITHMHWKSTYMVGFFLLEGEFAFIKINCQHPKVFRCQIECLTLDVIINAPPFLCGWVLVGQCVDDEPGGIIPG